MLVKHISRGNTALETNVFVVWYMTQIGDPFTMKNIFRSWIYRSEKRTSFYMLVHNFPTQKSFAMENTIEGLVNINGLWCSGLCTAW